MADWLKNYPPQSIVLKAYDFAQNAHRDGRRLNGEPYFTHCLAVAKNVRDWHLDET